MPHGRSVIAKHPGQIYGKHNIPLPDSSLLYKLSNIVIEDDSVHADKDDEKEWWTIREVYYRETKGEEPFLLVITHIKN